MDGARLGHLDAFESIVRSRTDAVYRLALAITGDEADARDAAQESFVAAWRELPRLRDADRFDAWLQRIVVNRCRMVIRARSRRRVREIPASLPPAAQADVAVASDADRLGAALSRLAPDQRAILALHHLEGRTIDELSASLGVPAGTVKSRLFTARRALERALGTEAGE